MPASGTFQPGVSADAPGYGAGVGALRELTWGRRKDVDAAIAGTEEEGFKLRRDLGALDVTVLGVGVIIGAGIFVLTGQAAADDAGPAIALSFVLAAVVCVFAALCYAEFAAMVPVAGSAYTFSYATLGELVAFVIGWDLALEFIVGASAVSVGWSAYLNATLEQLFDYTLPAAISGPPSAEGGFINLPAIAIVAFVAFLLVRGIRITAKANIVIVVITITVLYVLVALVITGMRPYQELASAAPVADAFELLDRPWVASIVYVGALLALTNTVLILMLGQTRVGFAMARDRLFPSALAQTHPRYGTPARFTILIAVLVSILAGFTGIDTLADLVSIGTLFAFILVAIGIVLLRRADPGRHRPFRTPWVPLVPILAVGLSIVLMVTLDYKTWLRFVGWMIIGLVVYFVYSRQRSRLG